MIKIHYRNDFKVNLGSHHKNILSYDGKIKDEQLPITEITWGFIWILIKNKLKHKVYFFVTQSLNNSQSFDFFYLKNK
jgi:hypothetical protein